MSFILVLLLIITTTWASLAVYFGNSRDKKIQLTFSILVACSGISAITSLLAAHSLNNWLLLIYSIIFLAVLLWWLNIKPSENGDWEPNVQKLPHADIKNNLVTVYDIRNFSYRSEFDYYPDYYNKTFDLNRLEGVDLFAVYWMGPAIAHIILSFDFGDNNYLAISIEARKQKGMRHSNIKGFFKQYELIYIAADERDVIGLRTNHRKNPHEDVYRYRIKAPIENIRRLFLSYMDSINSLYKKPVFYNTLLSNCTILIWLQNKIVNPGHIPFSWKILLSGYLPEYLYETGWLDQQLPFPELRDRAHVNPLIKEHEISSLFSSIIRTNNANPKY